MKKIITICILSILSLPIYADTIENQELLSNETEALTVFYDGSNDNKEEKEEKEEKEVINPIVQKEKANKFIREKGYIELPGELAGSKFGVDGTTKLADIDAGLEGMVEGVYRFSESGEIAMGLGVQGIGNINSAGTVSGNNYAIPLYFSGKYNFFKSPIYMKGILGVTFNYATDDLRTFIAGQEEPALGLTKDSIDMENGLYGALGFGVDIGKIEIEGLYSVNTISSSYTNPTDNKSYTRELENHRITVGASYAFDWNK